MLTKKQASQGVLWTRKEWRCPYIGRNKERRKEGEGRGSLRQQHRARHDDDDVVIGRELEEGGGKVTVRGYFGSKRLPNRGNSRTRCHAATLHRFLRSPFSCTFAQHRPNLSFGLPASHIIHRTDNLLLPLGMIACCWRYDDSGKHTLCQLQMDSRVADMSDCFSGI